MADTRIFKITRKFDGYVRRGVEDPGHVEYGNKRAASGKCSRNSGSYQHGPVVKVEATNAEATSGWEDVTAEFLSS